MNEEQDVKEAEQTAPSSPDETKQTSPPSEGDVKTEEEEEKKVPYARFKEVNDQLKLYRDLMSVDQKVKFQPPDTTVPQSAQPSYTGEEQAAWTQVRKMITEETEARKKELAYDQRRAFELQATIARYNDFPLYVEKIKQKITENPYMAWDDAYKSSKFDDLANETKQQTRQEISKKIEAKEAQVGEKSTAKSPGREERDLIEMIKDKSIPLSEIEKMLPHT